MFNFYNLFRGLLPLSGTSRPRTRLYIGVILIPAVTVPYTWSVPCHFLTTKTIVYATGNIAG